MGLNQTWSQFWSQSKRNEKFHWFLFKVHQSKFVNHKNDNIPGRHNRLRWHFSHIILPRGQNWEMYDCTQRKLNSLLISCIYKLNNLGTVALKKLQYLSSLQVIAEFDLRKTPYKKWTKQKRKMQKNGQNNWEKCMKIVLIDGSENKLKKRIGQISSWKYNISSGFYHPFSWGKWNCQLWPIVSFGTKKYVVNYYWK